jgi:hypothetical protein
MTNFQTPMKILLEPVRKSQIHAEVMLHLQNSMSLCRNFLQILSCPAVFLTSQSLLGVDQDFLLCKLLFYIAHLIFRKVSKFLGECPEAQHMSKEKPKYKLHGWESINAPTIKSILKSSSKISEIVFEREFGGSLPQKKREGYYLTELYNIRKLLMKQKEYNGDIDIKLKCTNTTGQTKKKTIFSKASHPEDRTLVFESKFESGNLCLAHKVCYLS